MLNRSHYRPCSTMHVASCSQAPGGVQLHKRRLHAAPHCILPYTRLKSSIKGSHSSHEAALNLSSVTIIRLTMAVRLHEARPCYSYSYKCCSCSGFLGAHSMRYQNDGRLQLCCDHEVWPCGPYASTSISSRRWNLPRPQ